MSDVRVFRQRSQVWKAMRGQVVMAPVLFLLGWLILGLALRFVVGESLMWLAWLLGAVLAAALTAGVLLLRKRQLDRNAGSGSLEVGERGLVATYGGTVRRLAWGDIERLDRIAYPSSTVRDGTSIGGQLMSAATTAGNRAMAAKPLGVVGAGVWEATKPTLEGQKLKLEAQQQLGTDAQGRQLVPIWLVDYEVEEQALVDLIRQRRPDLPVP